MKRTPFRRRYEGKTNYRKRLSLLKSGKPRVIVRKSNKNIFIQFANYELNGDAIITSAKGSDLKQFGWDFSFSSIPAAYLTGIIAGKKALRNNIEEGILDIGLYTPTKGARIFAALKGVADSGVLIPFSEDILPSEDRIYGKHISEDFAGKVQEIKKAIEEKYE
jgi:large subunit ribosomal protein L18